VPSFSPEHVEFKKVFSPVKQVKAAKPTIEKDILEQI
jgi:hypothetical protein